ncbi:PREDICTED: uncharacterized protein LOC109591948 [Amphimedon queenslandica]|uniref:Death domain-containing protein n=1 Tax=Amphimedon queenslandica TaxID=400682 RepID=A0A1X7SQE2_AMPQE|nr:PREDICTED: uncharacterized protein LOC109591948 [Amphimedon queenslandica]|eukprot:XP_019863098.1 PREDICTED: uncharacterized protein LOC109591948 [Amphimedon queenslandica]
MARLVHKPSILSGRTLDISDLDEVMALLERHHYSKTSYHELGLRLKVSHNTLENITKDQRDVLPCFRECLASWLRKADGVEDPTIDTLIAALRGIGETAVADGINGERQNIIAVSAKSEMSDRPMLDTSEEQTPCTDINCTLHFPNLVKAYDKFKRFFLTVMRSKP